MLIHIEFCVKWNYGPEFDRVSKEIQSLLPSTKIIGNKNAPRSGAFEITIDEKLVYSRFETQSFPSKNEIENFIND